MDDPHPFRLRNDLSEVPPLREQFASACAAEGVIDDDVQALMLVLTELVNNAIEHGCTRPGDVVEGSYRITTADIEIEVSNPSTGLSEASFQNSDAADFAENGRGAGLFLVRAMTDELSVAPALAGGTTVRVVRHRRTAGGAA